MRSYLFLPFLVLFALSQHSLLLSVTASIEDVCKAVATEDLSVKFNFCVASLEAQPNSRSADAKGLAIIATNLTKANAINTVAKIQNLLNGSLDPLAKTLLNTCTTNYQELTDLASSAIDALRASRVADAEEKLLSAVVKPISCDLVLFEGGKDSLLAKENNDCAELVKIAQSIASKLA